MIKAGRDRDLSTLISVSSLLLTEMNDCPKVRRAAEKSLDAGPADHQASWLCRLLEILSTLRFKRLPNKCRATEDTKIGCQASASPRVQGPDTS